MPNMFSVVMKEKMSGTYIVFTIIAIFTVVENGVGPIPIINVILIYSPYEPILYTVRQ